MARSFYILGATLVFIILNQNIFSQEETADISQFNASIELDGVMESTWDLFEPHPLGYMIDGATFPDSADCSGYYKAFWRNDSLFVLMFAVDDVVGTSSPNVWENDGYEIYFDLDNSKDEEYKDDNYQFRFNVGSSEVTGKVGFDNYNPPDIYFGLETYPENYRILEAVFPLVELGKAQPVAETYVGFDCQILDNDGSGRECALAWNNNEHEAYLNPSKMGTIYLSNEVVLSAPTTSFSFNLYPNPVNSTLFISSDIAIQEIRVLSLDGRILKTQCIQEGIQHAIDVDFLKPGIYLIELVSSQNHREIRRLIKSK